MEQASQLVRRLTRGDAMRLRFFALVLSRQQRRVGVPLPKYVVWRILSQFA